jgi:hypothetical protein
VPRTSPLAPTCKIFAVCKEIKGPDLLRLIGKDNRLVRPDFPSSCTIPVFIRLTGGHGEYELGLQLEDSEGNVRWKGTWQHPWCPESPRHTIEGPLTFSPVFPSPGDYYLVLTANGDEIGREPFYARHSG